MLVGLLASAGAGAGGSPTISFGDLTVRPLPSELTAGMHGPWVLAQVTDAVVAALDCENGRLATWDGERVVERGSFAPMPLMPQVFAYDPGASRLAIAAVPEGSRHGLGSRVAIWSEGRWAMQPEPKAKVLRLFWLGRRLHAAVMPCPTDSCSNRMSLADSTYVPRTFTVWKSTARGETEWDETAVVAVPAASRGELSRLVPLQPPGSVGAGFHQRVPGARRQPPVPLGAFAVLQRTRLLATGFLAPTTAGRVWFVPRGLGHAQLRDATGQLLAEHRFPTFPERHTLAAIAEAATGRSSCGNQMAVQAAVAVGEDLLALVTLEGGLSLLRVTPSGGVSSCLLPPGTRASSLHVAGGQVLLGADWDAILGDAPPGAD